MLRAVLIVMCAACAARPPAVAPPPAPAPPAEPAIAAPPVDPLVTAHLDAATRVAAAAKQDDGAWQKLSHLTDRIGHRLSGSAQLTRAVTWALETLRADGHENVRAEKVMVPTWVRGAESAQLVAPVRAKLALLALGGSPGTPPGGIVAEVVVVRDFDELARRAAEIPGKIVLYDTPMPPVENGAYGKSYGAAARYRGRGPARAARLGAVAALTRSVTQHSLRTPHTGATVFREGDKKIPAAALAVEDVERIARLAAAGEPVRVHLKLGARTLPDSPSANVVAELVGRERPEEIVVIGAHLDSWDVGQGAHDDGAGCAAVMQALALLRKLDLRPRRTIRVVLFTNEENGLAGGKGYAAQHAGELERHVAAIETDGGGFRPLGFGVETGPAALDAAVASAARLAPLLAPIGAGRIRAGHGGADIGPLGRAGVPLLGLEVDGKTYFDVHHTHADTLDKVQPEELALDAAAIAIMAYALAEMPETLPRDKIPERAPSE